MTCGKSLQNEKFRGTDTCSVQIDEAQIPGSAKYRRGRRMQFNLLESEEDDASEPNTSRLREWGVAENDMHEGNEYSCDISLLEEDHPEWNWTVGLYNGPG